MEKGYRGESVTGSGGSDWCSWGGVSGQVGLWESDHSCAELWATGRPLGHTQGSAPFSPFSFFPLGCFLSYCFHMRDCLRNEWNVDVARDSLMWFGGSCCRLSRLLTWTRKAGCPAAHLLLMGSSASAEWGASLPVPASVPHHSQGSDGSFFGDKAYCHVHS